MKSETRSLHDAVEQLGAGLGFDVSLEVSDSLLSLRLDAAYRPRIDLMWSLPLTTDQRDTVRRIVGRPGANADALPIVGIEVEGSGPSTKTLTADVVNMISLGTRLGLLVVVDGKDRVYRRAVRIIRTMRRAYGDIGVVPVDAGCLEDLAGRTWEKGPSPWPEIRTHLPAGGEGSTWLPRTRSLLKTLGERAGFLVAEPYIPPILEAAWSSTDRSDLEALARPSDGTKYRMRKWSDYFTGSQIDMAWLLPLPRSLQQFLSAISALDDTLVRDEFVYPRLYDHVAVIGFEFESNPGKHAAGGLANLAAYCTLGVVVAKDDLGGREMTKALRRYQPTLGLPNVVVRTVGELS